MAGAVTKQQVLGRLSATTLARSTAFDSTIRSWSEYNEETKGIAIQIAQYLNGIDDETCNMIRHNGVKSVHIVTDGASKDAVHGAGLFSLSLASAADRFPQTITLYAQFLIGYDSHYKSGSGYLLKQLLRSLIYEITAETFPENSLRDDLSSIQDTFLYATKQLHQQNWAGYLFIIIHGLESYYEENRDEADFLFRLEQEIHGANPCPFYKPRVIYVDCESDGTRKSKKIPWLTVPPFDNFRIDTSLGLQELMQDFFGWLPVPEELANDSVNGDTILKCLGVGPHYEELTLASKDERDAEGVIAQLGDIPDFREFLMDNRDGKAIIHSDLSPVERNRILRTFITTFEDHAPAGKNARAIHAICPTRDFDPDFLLRSLLYGIIKQNGQLDYPMWMISPESHDLWRALRYLIKDAIDRESETDLIFVINDLSDYAENNEEETEKLSELPFLLSHNDEIHSGSKKRKFRIKALFTAAHATLSEAIARDAKVINL